MSEKKRQTKDARIDKAVRLLNSGKTQAETAKSLGISTRTIQRWLKQPEIGEKVAETRREIKAIAQSDPVVLSITDIRLQVEQIVSYRDTQRNFALEMGLVVQKATSILLQAVERLEQNPDEVSARTIPQLMKAITDAAEKVSLHWVRATGLDDLLEELGSEPKAVAQGQEED
jgi:transposase